MRGALIDNLRRINFQRMSDVGEGEPENARGRMEAASCMDRARALPPSRFASAPEGRRPAWGGPARSLQFKQYQRVDGTLEFPQPVTVQTVQVRVVDAQGSVRASQDLAL